jgi:hypothetical protein
MKLRFSIRDLLWLTLVAALVMGWIVSDYQKGKQLQLEKDARERQERRNAQLLRQLEKSRGVRIHPLANI